MKSLKSKIHQSRAQPQPRRDLRKARAARCRHPRVPQRPAATHPQYEAWRRALARLAGSGTVAEHLTDAEKLAATLAERAGAAARRGDYAEAMKQLDEAQHAAPRFPRVYQYRANVAFLMGDRATAKIALQKGLELEPDNALFRANLQRLEQPAQ